MPKKLLMTLETRKVLYLEIESLVRMIVSNEGSPFIFHMRLIQLLSFSLKHMLVTYGCHKSPKLTISIYRPRCATLIQLSKPEKFVHSGGFEGGFVFFLKKFKILIRSRNSKLTHFKLESCESMLILFVQK